MPPSYTCAQGAQRREVHMKTASLRDGATRLAGTGDGMLVDPEWLHAPLSDPRVRVVEVDVSPAAYNDWHIDGATLWNVYADLKDADYRLADTARVERLGKRAGEEPGPPPGG